MTKLRALRKQVLQNQADPESMAWFQSGDLDKRLEKLTLQHGTGRFWDTNGNQIDLRPHAFEDFVVEGTDGSPS